MRRIRVKLKDRSYSVSVGTGLTTEVAQLVKRASSEGRVFVIYDARIYALYGKRMTTGFQRRGLRPINLSVEGHERSKSLSTLDRVQSFLIENGVSRDDFILAYGGGVVTDLAGFAASTVLRGVRWGIVSSTLLGMVDASVGGKTAINHQLGKNLIGTFWQPTFVVCDIDLLQTLPERHLLSGLGEVLKTAGLAGERAIGAVRRYLERGDLFERKELSRLVAICARYKADIVSRDEREGRLRMVLNLGHTFGHGIENALGHGRLLHGEAVTLGLLAAVELSCLLKPARRERLRTITRLVEVLVAQMPRRRIDLDTVMDAMRFDKKRHGTTNRFVILDGPGKPLIVEGVSKRLVRASLEKMDEQYRQIGG